MNIDFNGIRLMAIKNYNRVINELNSELKDGYLSINDTTYLRKCLDDLRSDLVGIAISYMENDETCKCVLSDEIHLKWFNEEV